jgi:hypothetical protein
MLFQTVRDNKKRGSFAPAQPSAVFARLLRSLLILFVASGGVLGLLGGVVQAAVGEAEFMHQEAAKIFSDQRCPYDSPAMMTTSSPVSVVELTYGDSELELPKELALNDASEMSSNGGKAIPPEERLVDQACDEKEENPLPDRRGIKRDTMYFFGYQIVAVGILYVLPESITKWSDEQKKEYDLDRWAKNVRNPAWDDDRWYVNYVLHPYWGAAYYTRARERGFGELESFLYSAFLSSSYEFGVEALFEQPSFQDLIVTPIAGSLIGWAIEPVRGRIKAKGPEQLWYDKLFLVLTDPLGAANSLVDGLLGIKSSVSVKNGGGKTCAKPHSVGAGQAEERGGTCRSAYKGVELTFMW